MKTYKKGISLIVLVITVIVLAILATTVIISLSNTNIISQANKTVFKSDMANYKELYSFYLADKLMEDETFNSSTLNVTSSDAEFTRIFGDNVKDAYKEKLQVVNGKLVYKTLDATETEIVESLGMAVALTALSEVKVGDLVEYIPTAEPNGSFEGATYIESRQGSGGAPTYLESTDYYTPGELSWVYLGQDENGNILLTSQETTSFTVSIVGQDAWVNGIDRMNSLCNTLYGNSKYGYARNMKMEDIDRVLGYNGPKGVYYDKNFNEVKTAQPMTIGDIESAENVTISMRIKPRLSTTEFQNYLVNAYSYVPTEYKAENSKEYELIFKNKDKTAFQSDFILSSSAVYYYVSPDHVGFQLLTVSNGSFSNIECFSNKYGEYGGPSLALRPVIVLNSNIQFGEKNLAGEWKLVEM